MGRDGFASLDGAHIQAAYGLFYLDNQPVLVRAAELSPGSFQADHKRLEKWGFNATRPSSGRLSPRTPFTASLRAARAGIAASDDEPPVILGLRPVATDVLAAIARGVKGYSIALEGDPPPELDRLQAWLDGRAEEVTASVEVRDLLGYLDYRPYHDIDTLHGAFGVLATSGYNPTLVDLNTVKDSEIGALPAALFPCGGELDVEHYGKLVVHTLHGGTLVTYPQPVRAQHGGYPLRTTYLWPHRPRVAESGWRTRIGLSRRAERELGSTVQVRDGTSTLLTTLLGEPYATDAYYRLPAAQRLAHRQLVVSLFDAAVPRQIVPDDSLEVELVARLSPDGGALVFVINRLGPQEGTIRFPYLYALNLSEDWSTQIEFTASGSTGRRVEGGVRLRIEREDALVIRLR